VTHAKHRRKAHALPDRRKLRRMLERRAEKRIKRDNQQKEKRA
jgi:hypothetical protein